MKKELISLTLMAFYAFVSPAQSSFCGVEKNDQWENSAFKSKLHSLSDSPKSTYNVPVVFHLVHQGGAENVPDSVVINWISELNERFANSGSFQTPDGVDVDINFCLAEKDTNGLPTTGITRDYSEFSHMYSYINSNGLSTSTDLMDSICRLYHWKTKDYLNVYLVKNLFVAGSARTGWGFFPNSNGYYMDGVFLYHAYMNSADTFFYYPGLFEHEVGHYLGLYHTFQGGCLNNDCTVDNDNVCDTPPVSYPNNDCQTSNSCLSDADDQSTNNPFRPVALGGLGDQPDDLTNYMDYTKCADHFTLGQKNRMIAALTTIRTSLLSSDGCGITWNSISENDDAFLKFALFPNPFFDRVTIPFGDFKSCEFTLYSITGTIVSVEMITEDLPEVELTDVSSGTYFYRLNFDNNRKIVIGKLSKE